MTREPGTYVLQLACRRRARVPIGRLGLLDIAPGRYLYVGSAFGPGGLGARVGRHLRRDKPARWHIDHLRPFVTPEALWCSRSPERLEHRWAQALAALAEATPVLGFGASDCGCRSHLIYLPDRPAAARLARALGPGAELCVVARRRARRP